MRESLFSAYTLFFHATSVIILFSGLCKAYHDYCVIGAGPAGLQMGYFFQKANRSYVIFEKSNISGELIFFFFLVLFLLSSWDHSNYNRINDSSKVSLRWAQYTV